MTRSRRTATLMVLATLLPVSSPSAAAAPSGRAAPASTDTATLPGKEVPPPESAEMPTWATGSIDDAGAAPMPSRAAVLSPEVSLRLARTAAPASLTVEVLGADPAAALTAAGGTAIHSIGGIALAELSPAQVRAVALQPGVTQVRVPVDLRRGLLGSGATEPTRRGDFASQNESPWLLTAAGTGVKVGIIDLFDPTVLATQIAHQEVPDVPPAQRACFYQGAPCPFGTPGYHHGNEVAEVLAEGAPGAALYLVEVGTITDYLMAIDWFATNGVTIVNHSATGPLDGPGDGTGPSASVVDYAVAHGMAWFNAAGNMARDPNFVKFSGGYFRGNWYDANGNRWMNWYGTDESLSVYCGALMGVRWSDWGALRTDYDLYVSDYRYSTKVNGTKVLISAANQAAGAAPIEGNDMRWLCNTNPANGPVHDLDGDGFVSLWLYRTTRSTAPTTGDLIEVMLNGGYLEYPTNAGTAGIPFGDTRNPGAASVGGVDSGGYLQWYSSRGPTNDGRIKPDFVWQSCLDTSVEAISPRSYCQSASFNGTSASTPVVAAYGAAGAGAFGLTTPALTISWLRSISPGAAAKNNDIGWGKPVLPEGPYTPQAAGYTPLTPSRVLDTRGLNGQPIGAPIGVRAADSITTIDLSQVLYSYPNRMPFDATVALNVAMVNATGNGWLQVYPTGQAAPGQTSSINVGAGQTRANFVLVQTNHGRVSFYSSGGGHIIADLVGVFGQIGLSPSPLVAIPPYHTWDTATCGTCPGGTLAAGTYVDVPVAGTVDPSDAANGVPAMNTTNAPRAVVLSISVSGAADKGYLSVVRSNTTAFTTSTLNYMPGEALTTTTFMPVDALTSGQVRIFSSRTVQVRVDVLGYFATSSRGGEGWFVGRSPARYLDTRASGKVAAGDTATTAVAGTGKIPAHDVGTVFLNTTSVHASGPGHLSSGATAGVGDYVTTSIPAAALPVAAGSIARLSEDGSLHVYTDVTSNIIADIGGYFTSAEPGLATGITPVLEAPGGGVTDIDISDDGGVVAYSLATSVYLWNRLTDTTTHLATTVHQGLALSGDGTILAFATNESLGVGDTGDTDVYAYRVADAQYERLTTVGHAYNRALGISDDGSRVLIGSSIAAGPSDTNGVWEPYVLDRVAAVAYTSPVPLAFGAQISGDGLHVLAKEPVGGNSADVRDWNVALGTTQVHSPQSFLSAAGPDDVSTDGTQLIWHTQNSSERYDATTNVLTPLPIRYWDNSSYTTAGRISGDGSVELLLGQRAVALDLDPIWDSTGTAVLLVQHSPFRVVTVSRTESGAPPSMPAKVMDLSDDGHWAVYATFATNVTSTSGATNIYLVDLSQL